jgi:hypothetical protein
VVSPAGPIRALGPPRTAAAAGAALLAAVALAAPSAGASGASGAAANCAQTSIGRTPLSDLGHARYRGELGGLYPQASNRPPTAYRRQGVAHARQVQPLDRSGPPSPSGRIGFVSIGMSNASDEFSAFKQVADSDPRKNPRVTIVDGAVGGFDAARIAQPASPYWPMVDARLAAAGLTPSQVQVVWLKEAIAGEHEPFPQDANALQRYLDAIIQILGQRFVHLQLVYLASRTYAGYATSPLNPEPYAYDSGFAVRGAVVDRIQGRLHGAWVGWGPYLWTDGTRGRSDGLRWTCADVGPDGTHPSSSGRMKVASLLLSFFTRNATARGWFIRQR